MINELVPLPLEAPYLERRVGKDDKIVEIIREPLGISRRRLGGVAEAARRVEVRRRGVRRAVAHSSRFDPHGRIDQRGWRDDRRDGTEPGVVDVAPVPEVRADPLPACTRGVHNEVRRLHQLRRERFNVVQLVEDGIAPEDGLGRLRAERVVARNICRAVSGYAI